MMIDLKHERISLKIVDRLLKHKGRKERAEAGAGKKFTPFIVMVGPSASGKDYIARFLGKAGYTKAYSYTTRPRRESEKGHPTHIHISEADMLGLRMDNYLAAYTKFNGYEYGTAKQDLLETDIAILDPNGVANLEWPEGYERPLLMLHVNAPETVRVARMIARGDGIEKAEERAAYDRSIFPDTMFSLFSDFGTDYARKGGLRCLLGVVSSDPVVDPGYDPLVNLHDNLFCIVETLDELMTNAGYFLA